jgi:hypothetical protein
MRLWERFAGPSHDFRDIDVIGLVTAYSAKRAMSSGDAKRAHLWSAITPSVAMPPHLRLMLKDRGRPCLYDISRSGARLILNRLPPTRPES